VADSKLMHMVTDTSYAADGQTVLYGAGELHDPGSLPDGVGYREVVASGAMQDTAPEHAGGAKAAKEDKAAAPPPAAPKKS